MQIASFLPHYQLVCISFDISSFSLISYVLICTTFLHKTVHFTRSKSPLFLLINDDCAQKEKAVTLQLHINKTWK